MGTAGIAMFAVGESMGVPIGMTVGAIVSGSYLGDMVSPMSDSTNVVSAGYQGHSIFNLIPTFWTGYKISTGEAFLDTLLNRVGVQSMFSSAFMMLFAFGMIGALNKVGILDAIVNPIVAKIKNVIHLTAVSRFISIIGNTMGTNTFSLLMTGSLMAPVYKKFDLHPTNLSKAINATSTVLCVFIPWNASGIFVIGLFGGSVLDFMPYAVYSYLMPIAALLAVVFKFRVIPIDKVLD